jgi:hypothetical protein
MSTSSFDLTKTIICIGRDSPSEQLLEKLTGLKLRTEFKEIETLALDGFDNKQLGAAVIAEISSAEDLDAIIKWMQNAEKSGDRDQIDDRFIGFIRDVKLAKPEKAGGSYAFSVDNVIELVNAILALPSTTSEGVAQASKAREQMIGERDLSFVLVNYVVNRALAVTKENANKRRSYPELRTSAVLQELLSLLKQRLVEQDDKIAVPEYDPYIWMTICHFSAILILRIMTVKDTQSRSCHTIPLSCSPSITNESLKNFISLMLVDALFGTDVVAECMISDDGFVFKAGDPNFKQFAAYIESCDCEDKVSDEDKLSDEVIKEIWNRFCGNLRFTRDSTEVNRYGVTFSLLSESTTA